jgi:hypothetical protein
MDWPKLINTLRGGIIQRMQHVCSNCRYPLQPGSTVCTNCGTPVSTAGGGSYDPTLRAGAAPGSGYGQPGYGTPSAPDSYSAQYGSPSPYGTPPGGSYGAQPGNPYGAPQANPYGTPQAPVFTPVATPPKSRRGALFGGIAIIVVVIVGIVIAAGIFGKFKQEVTTGTHITKIQVGTGQDPNTFEVTGATDTFHTGDTVYVSFTVTTQESGAQVVLKLYAGSDLQDSTDPVTLDQGTTTYGNSAVVNKTGEHKFEVDYNGVSEATITFNVT